MLNAENSSSDMAERDWVTIKALVVKKILSTELIFKQRSTWKFNAVRKWGGALGRGRDWLGYGIHSGHKSRGMS